MGPTSVERTVLLVEDNPGDARLIMESLRSAGGTTRVTHVSTLAEAREACANDHIEAIILDLGLPDSTGLATFQSMEEAAPDLPVIIMSGDVDTRTALLAVQEGAQDFLVKGHADGELLSRAIAYAIERKKAEALIAESEEKFRYIFDRSMVAKSLTTPDGRIDVNDAFCSMLGYTHEELADGATWMQLTHPDDVNESVRQVNSVLTGEMSSTRFEKRFLHKDGRVVWAEVSTSLRRDSQGEPLYFMTAILDITERKRAEEDLRRSEEDLRQAQSIARIGSYAWDMAEGHWTSSETMDDIFGIDETYVRDLDGWLALVYEADRDMMGTYVAEEVVGKGLPFDKRYRVTRATDGRTVWVHGHGRVETAPDGTPLRLVGAIQDVSAQHDYEQEILSANQRLGRMIREVEEAMGGIVETRDPYTQGHQLGVARLAIAIARAMGFDPVEVDSLEMAALLHDIGKLSVPAEILTKPGALSDMEWALIREHPLRGHTILSKIEFPAGVSEIVLQHHERCDGSGYPMGLTCGETMPLARVLSVADVIEAMAAYRPYRPALGLAAALEELRANPEKYDPEAVAAVFALHERGELPV